MSLARCNTCGTIVDCDDDPAAPQAKGTFKCAWCRGELNDLQEEARRSRLYARLRAPSSSPVNRRTMT